MATSNDRLRARYGICLSDSCQKCKDKTVQIITGRKDFVCEECGKPLREVPRPLTAWEKHGKKVIGGVVALAVIGGATAYFTLGGSDNAKDAKDKPQAEQTQQTEPKDTVKQDSAQTVKVEPVKEDVPKPDEPKPEPAKEKNGKKEDAKEKSTTTATSGTSVAGTGSVRLGYGTYRGETRNGKPHGHGTITFTAAHKIVASKDFVAQPGDKFEGEFRDGIVSGGIGYWYHDGDITAVKP